MALTKNSWRVLATLGFDLVKEGISLPINRIIIHHDEDSEKVFSHANNIFPDPKTIQWVERGPLQNLLLERFEKLGGAIVFESSVNDISVCPDGDLVAILSNGQSCAGDYIIGADGVNSNVRKYLYTKYPPTKAPSRCPMGELWPYNILRPLSSLVHILTRAKKPEVWEASPLPWTALYGITSPLPQRLLTGGETGEGALGTMHWYLRGVSGCYSTCSLQDGRVFWVCYNSEPVSKGTYFTAEQAEENRKSYDAAPYCSAIPNENGEVPVGDAEKNTKFQEITSRSERIKKVRLHHTMFYEISNPAKNILLIGDAAHAMSTFRGQGAGIGIEEAVVLCNGLLRSAWQAKEPDLEASPEMVGIGYFEKLRMERSERITSSGWYFGFAVMGDWWITRVIRDRFLRIALKTPTPHQSEEEERRAGAGNDNEDGANRRKRPTNWLIDHQVNVDTDERKYWHEYEENEKIRLNQF
ncbi:uncharacterized protein LAJ45_09101 [Morchella importuna]|uniref:uncharacterized protein n=1 Tax=Morchella importuna TaxID=1174673 RepID=UPI001E8DF81B|nr:uncharacterized protein LAJ45_09101 [Morchella importuna]KAH8146727.1 hypothetical protein LAJ45_09101 [Morchella importuna]